MNQAEDREAGPVPGLSRLRVDELPARELWPGIQARIQPQARRNRAPWVSLALAASLMLMFALPLRMQMTPGEASPVQRLAQQTRPLASADENLVYASAQMRVVQGAEQELLAALRQKPESAALQKLLENTRNKQRNLRRLMMQST